MGAKSPWRYCCSIISHVVFMTHNTAKAYNAGLLFISGALLLGLMTAPASAGFAQNSPSGYAQNSGDMTQLMGRINQLENQIQTLSRSVYRGGKMPAPMAGETSSLSGGALTQYEDRIGSLESQQRHMTGQLEQLTYDVGQMKTQLEKALADYDLRLQQLERGGAAAPGITSGNGVLKPAGSQPELTGNLYADSPQTLGTLSSTGKSAADVLYEQGFTDIRNGKYESAADSLQKFMRDYSTHPLASNAQYWLGETYYVRGDYKQAAKQFAQGYQSYPKGAKAADSLLKLGLSLSKLNKKDDACLSFQQLKKEFPGDTTPTNRRAAQEMQSLGCP